MDINLNEKKLMSILESYMFTFSELLELKDIQYFFKESNVNLKEKEILEIITKLKEKYEKEDSGLEIIKINEKYQLVTKKENFKYLKNGIEKVKKKSLTNSALETLTIIAYNSPCTKSFVEKIKGVKQDSTIGKLVEYGFVREKGRLDKIGRPILYEVTEKFLKYVNLESLDELPYIDEIRKNKEEELVEK